MLSCPIFTCLRLEVLTTHYSVHSRRGRAGDKPGDKPGDPRPKADLLCVWSPFECVENNATCAAICLCLFSFAFSFAYSLIIPLPNYTTPSIIHPPTPPFPLLPFSAARTHLCLSPSILPGQPALLALICQPAPITGRLGGAICIASEQGFCGARGTRGLNDLLNKRATAGAIWRRVGAEKDRWIKQIQGE
jgi:hypothetical protein